MNKNIKKLVVLLAGVCLLMTSCNIPANSNEKETVEEEIFAFGIEKGMTLDEVVAILGEDYADVGSGAIILEWVLEEESQKVHVWIVNDADHQPVVQRMKIKSMEKETE